MPPAMDQPIDKPATQEDHASAAPRRATARFMLAHPARWVALGFGSGLSPLAPGTVGTLWGWASYKVLALFLTPGELGMLIAASLGAGWWACTRTAVDMRVADPGAIVWDEIVAFWIVMWVLSPAGLWWELLAFGLFRFFDAAKPGPVGWADRRFKNRRHPWARGFGILWDDLVAAGCTLMVLAVLVAVWGRADTA
jgi:phosphatidylglycerophosphatase A